VIFQKTILSTSTNLGNDDLTPHGFDATQEKIERMRPLKAPAAMVVLRSCAKEGEEIVAEFERSAAIRFVDY
jgi:hypothetical protein